MFFEVLLGLHVSCSATTRKNKLTIIFTTLMNELFQSQSFQNKTRWVFIILNTGGRYTKRISINFNVKPLL